MTKKVIPKALREQVWKATNGDSLTGTCYVCKYTLYFNNFEVGHIMAEATGGEMTVDNLRAVCRPCNRSCSTKNMDDFKHMLTSTNNNNKKDNETIYEFYKHEYAREILVKWLNSSRKLICGFFLQFSSEEGDRLLLDYPLVIPDEKIGAISFEFCGLNNESHERAEFYKNKLINNIYGPTYSDCLEFGDIPVTILDVACVTNVQVYAGFIICNQFDVNKYLKKNLEKYFNGCDIKIYEIKENDIINQKTNLDNIFKYCKQII